MSKKPRIPTDAQEVAINRGIAQDPDNPELDDAFFANARPAAEVLSKAIYANLARPRGRPPGQKPAKVLVSVRVAPDVLARLRASGPGWLVRAEEALNKLAEG